MALLDFTGSPHGGRQRHLPEWQSQPRIKPITIIDHSIVGSAEVAWQHFKNNSVLESHFIVDLDGEIWQLMDTDRQGDANLKANDYAISIETADNGDPDNFPWTIEQMDSLRWLHEELVLLHPTIPRRKSRSCADPGGLGYHTLHGAPSCWTPVSKSCPGEARKEQWPTLLVAFLNPMEEIDDMPTPKEVEDAVLNALKRFTAPGGIIPGQDAWADYPRVLADREAKILTASTETNRLLGELIALQTAPAPEPPPEPPA